MNQHRVLIIGARRNKQGLGEFIAQGFNLCGAKICSIVGTSPETLKQATDNLKTRYQIETHGYTDLRAAIEETAPSIVAICSPYQFHLQQLQIIAEYGLHCLCEKPLCWDEDSVSAIREVERIIEQFRQNNRLLQLVAQWPFTLDEYFSLFPDVKNQPPRHFNMLLGPLSSGTKMVVDALPHILSMIYTLVGVGTISDIQSQFGDDQNRLRLDFQYQHENGNLIVTVNLVKTLERPRPAGYAINGYTVTRKIELPEYQTFFIDNFGREIKLEDPLQKLIHGFLDDIDKGFPTKMDELIASIRDLGTIIENVNLHTNL